MKKLLFILFTFTLLATSCRSLTSHTYIKAYDNFVLGDNEHGGYEVKMRNTSRINLAVYQKAKDGSIDTQMVAKPNEWITLKVGKDKALFVGNKSDGIAEVDFIISSNYPLSMGYKK
jgi:hypothetical protein